MLTERQIRHARIHAAKKLAMAARDPARFSPRRKRMKKMLATLLCFCCSSALAQTAQELIDNGKNSENVTTFGMGYSLGQYSPLSQINKSNIKRLVPVWSTSLSN